MAQSILEESKKAKRGIMGIIFKKKFLIIAFLLLVIGGAGYYYFNKNNQSKTNVVTKKQYTAKKEDLKISVSSTGKVVAKDGVELSSSDTLELIMYLNTYTIIPYGIIVPPGFSAILCHQYDNLHP